MSHTHYIVDKKASLLNDIRGHRANAHALLLHHHALGAASAVTNRTVVRPARVVIFAGSGHRAFMYAPVVETLRAGFLHATPHVAVRSSGHSDPQWAAQQQLRRGDV